MEILIVSGLSGSGKSKAASFLEDMGYYIIDNMPAEMILKFAEFCAAGNARYDRAALVYDIRSGGNFKLLFEIVNQLKERVNCRLLFLTASDEVIIRRYKETRRLHPLADRAGSLEEAVHLEQEMLREVQENADHIIDTSALSTAKLRSELIFRFGGESDGGDFTVSFLSFGYKHGLPLEADLVFDVRFLPNPFYIENLRGLTGKDAPVRDYVMSFPETEEYLSKLRDLLAFSLPLYRAEGKTMLVIAVGCTGGHHRSVALSCALAEYVRSLGYRVKENHRDMSRE